jgi:hypothetical protein
VLFCVIIAVMDVSSGSLDFSRPFATYFIAVVNGFFVFASAAGLSAGGAAVAKGTSAQGGTRRARTARGTAETSEQPEAGFWRYWL